MLCTRYRSSITATNDKINEQKLPEPPVHPNLTASIVYFISCKKSFLSTSIFIENPPEESLSKILCTSLKCAWSFQVGNTLNLLFETVLFQGHTKLFSSKRILYTIKALHVKNLLQISASCSVQTGCSQCWTWLLALEMSPF